MEKKKNKRGIKIAVILGVVLIVLAAVWFLFLKDRFGGNSGNVVYVDTLAHYMGVSPSGASNRYAGVVESQESWSVNANMDMENSIGEVYVKAGDVVEAGTPLFTYNTETMNDDLTQAKIDLQRLQNEKASLNTVIGELEKEKAQASSSEQADYMIQIEEEKLAIQQKDMEIASKQEEVKKLEDSIANATVKSEIAGVVKSVNNGNQNEGYGYGGDDAFITIMRTSDLRVKGTVNEQNIGEITEGATVTIFSRVDPEKTWRGVIEKIDMESTSGNQNDYYYDEGSGESSSSSYPFYVTLESSEGLMLGQHVYVSAGDLTAQTANTLWVDEYLIDLSDESHPVVWADNGKGKLEKRKITLGTHDEEKMQYEVLTGLALTDYIAYPDESLREGMPTATMESMAEMEEDGGSSEDGYVEGEDEESEEYDGDGDLMQEPVGAGQLYETDGEAIDSEVFEGGE